MMSEERVTSVAADVAGSSSRMIIQQCVSATLEVRPANAETAAQIVQINRGVIIYVCFLQGATMETVYKMVKSALNVRLSESDSKLVSILELPGDVLIVPQATLGGRAKGRSMQYHRNIDKQTGSRLYEQFVTQCREVVQQTAKQCTVHCGTYGNRQVLSIVTNGPYSHVIDV